MIVIATLSSERAQAPLRNRYEIIFHDCFTTVIANRLIHIGSAGGRFEILIFFLTTLQRLFISETSRISLFGTIFVLYLCSVILVISRFNFI